MNFFATPFRSLSALLVLSVSAAGETVTVRNADELKSALRAAKPGMTLRIAAGEYPGGNFVSGVEKLTVEALDPKNPPHFKGGPAAWHCSKCPGLTLRHLQVSGQTANGINLDDGADTAKLVAGISLENLTISDIGPKGNHDGIKGSGLDGLTVKNCTISGWGGQGIDLVGCHRSLITGCRLAGKEGFTASAGVQVKGGSADIVVEKCRFENAGERPVNIGGSTGLPYFRPPGARHEAAHIIVRENVIEGGLCAAAFVGVDGAEFSGNTILFPQKWVFRILQENTSEGFVPCRNGVISENRIVFRRSQVQTDVNIGGNTAPQSFRFAKNAWFAEDRPQNSKPALPTPEPDGTHGKDPR